MKLYQGVMSSALLLLLFTCCVMSSDKGHKEKDTCNSFYNKTSGSIHYRAHSPGLPPEAVSCSWIVAVNNSNAKGNLFLYVDDFALNEDDRVTIKDNKTGDLIYSPFKGELAPFGLVIEQTSIIITLETLEYKGVDSRSFSVQYSTVGCDYNVTVREPDTISSPQYPKNYSQHINCTFRFNPSNKDLNALLAHFTNFNLVNGNVTVKNHVFNKTATPNEIVGGDLTVNLFIPNATVNENFTLYYELTSKGCSDEVFLTDGKESKELDAPTLADLKSRSMNCHWVVESKDDSIISVDLSNIVLPQATDQILILDGPNRTSSQLALVTSANIQSMQDQYIISSTNHLWISIVSQAVSLDLKAKITVTQKKAGGHFKNNANLTIDNVDESFFLLEVETGNQAKFEIPNGALAKGGILTFYTTFTKTATMFAALDKASSANLVVAPGNKMLVKATGFKDLKLEATLSEVKEGCYSYGLLTGGTYKVSGNCDNNCSWTIPKGPENSSDIIIFHFPALSLTKDDNMLITKLGSNISVVANVTGETHSLPDIVVPAKDGALLQVNRGNCKDNNSLVLLSSYVVQSACSNEPITPKSGETVNISSQNYPEFYPLESECSWEIGLFNTSSWLLVSFLDINLASTEHTLEIFVVNITNQTTLAVFNGNTTVLPNDMLLNSHVGIKFTSKSKNATNFKSSPGFLISFTAIDWAEIHNTSQTDTISTPNAPHGIENDSLLAWLVEVPKMNSTPNEKNIIVYEFLNVTDAKDLEKCLTIYDGPSIRDTSGNNVTNATVLSRTNTLLFLYRHEHYNGSSPAMILSFSPHACNYSYCTNGICMHEDWHCNGINDCKDWSDEKDCQGVAPTPPPTPAPSPAPAAKGATTTALALGILAALLIGVLIGVGAPAALRRIRGNRFSTYSTFSNSPE